MLWGREDFHNPFVIEETGKPLWNVVELARVADGSDTDAPTVVNLLRVIATQVRSNSAHFVRSGANRPSPEKLREQQEAIEAQAGELEKLAAMGFQGIVDHQRQVEEVFSTLQALGTRAPDRLVSNVAQALTAVEPRPREMASEGKLAYRGCEITWPRKRMFAHTWTVNVTSENPHLLMKLGGRTLVIDDPRSLESAVQKAKQEVDAHLAA